MKYLVTVKEIYEHTYLVDATDEEDAECIVADKSDGCDVFEDYIESEYSVRVPDGEDLELYEEIK